jgi:hypothetical protein
MEYTKHLEAPDLFHLWVAVGTVAGALQRKVWIDQYHFQWSPNFFIVLVAPPGVVSKSTSANIGMDLLRNVEGVSFGPDSVTWQALFDSFQDSATVVEGVGTTSPLTVAASELGTFLDPQNRELVDVLNDMWDGKERPITRRTRGEGLSTIEKPWLNLIGCTTPGWLEEHVPSVMFKGGFMSRTVFVYQEKKRFLTAYVREKMGQGVADFAVLRQHLINDLRTIHEIKGEYTLTPAAIQWGKDWYERHWTDKNPHGLDKELFGPYFARKQTHIHKLAIVLSAAETNRRVLDVYHIEQAEKLVTSLEPNMNRVLGAIVDTTEVRQVAFLCRLFTMSQSAIGKQDAWRICMRQMSLEEFYNALRASIAAGFVREQGTGSDLLLVPNLPEIAAQYGGTAPESYSLKAHHSPEVSPSDSAGPQTDGEHLDR